MELPAVGNVSSGNTLSRSETDFLPNNLTPSPNSEPHRKIRPVAEPLLGHKKLSIPCILGAYRYVRKVLLEVRILLEQSREALLELYMIQLQIQVLEFRSAVFAQFGLQSVDDDVAVS
jgi:hypothetical protein